MIEDDNEILKNESGSKTNVRISWWEKDTHACDARVWRFMPAYLDNIYVCVYTSIYIFTCVYICCVCNHNLVVHETTHISLVEF